MKNKKFNLISKVTFFVFSLTLFTNIIPEIDSYGESTKKVKKSSFNTTLEINDKPITNGESISLNNGDSVNFKLNFTCNPNINPGDKLTFKLPSVFSEIKTLTYPYICFDSPVIENNTVTLTANENIVGVIGGYITMQATFNSQNTTGSIKVPIEVNGEISNVTINYTPPIGISLNKTVNDSKTLPIKATDINNPLNYKIIVNTKNQSTTENFKDVMDSGLDLDDNSLQITNSKGVNITSQLKDKIKIQKTQSNTTINVSDFPIGDIYTVTYTCNINKAAAENRPLWYRENTATMGSVSSNSTVIINSNLGNNLTPEASKSLTQKSVNGQTYEKVGDIKNYTLTINSGNFELPIGTTITDKLPDGLTFSNNTNSGLNAWLNSPYNGGTSPGLTVYKISEDGNKSTIYTEKDTGVTITLDYQTGTISCTTLVATNNKITINFNTKITKKLDSITNTAITGINGTNYENSTTIKYSSPENVKITKTVNGMPTYPVRQNQITKPLRYKVVVDTTDMTTPKTYTDNMQTGIKLLKDTLKIVNSQNEDVTSQFKDLINISSNSDGTITTIKDFPVGNVYTITYEAMPDPQGNLVWTRTNTASLGNGTSTATVILNSDVGAEVTPDNIKTLTNKTLSNGTTFSNIGDVKNYTLNINSQNLNLPVGSKVIDKLPSQLVLDNDNYAGIKANAMGPGGIFAPGGIQVYWIDKDGNSKVIQNVPIPIASLTADSRDNTLTFEVLKESNTSYVISFNTKITEIADKIINSVSTTVGSNSATNSATMNFSSDAGLISVRKSADKTTLTNNPDDQKVNYSITVKSYGAFPTNYLNITDTIDSLIKIENVEVPSGFSYSIDKNNLKITNTSPVIGTLDKPISYTFTISTNFKDVKSGSTISNTAIINEVPTNTVKIKKGVSFKAVKAAKDSKDTVLKDAVYGVYSEDNTLLYKITSDSNGILEGSLDTVGNYYLKEITPPTGYKLSDEKTNFTITANDLGTVITLPTIYDEPILGSLEILKTDFSSKLPLEGAVFQVTGPNDFKQTITSNKNGLCNISNLPWGTYSVKEIKAPLGYDLNTTAQEFNINQNSLSSKLSFTNKRLSGSLEIFKTDSSSKTPLKGAIFEVTGPNNFKETITSDKNGLCSIPNLPWGAYSVKEIKAPLGYEIDTTPQEFNINQTSLSSKLYFTNKRLSGSLEILKTDSSLKTPLEGAVFEITGPNNFKETITSDKNGLCSISNLPWGNYSVKEIKAPLGYILDSTPYEFTINETSLDIPLGFANKKMPDTDNNNNNNNNGSNNNSGNNNNSNNNSNNNGNNLTDNNNWYINTNSNLNTNTTSPFTSDTNLIIFYLALLLSLCILIKINFFRKHKIK
ncbi:MAG: MSCRAMM family protein [Clostridium sp.]